MSCVSGSKVLGVQIHGEVVSNCDVILDNAFKALPIPKLLGVPVLCKRLPVVSGHGGHSEAMACLTLEPNGGEASGKHISQPVQLAREDKLPFSTEDCTVLNGYIRQWVEMAAELKEMSEEGVEIAARLLTPERFYKFATRSSVPPSGAASSTVFLSLRFPLGCVVEASGLSKAELNGVEGTVVQYARDRVGVKYSTGTCAVRPERLTVLRAAQEDDGSEDESAASSVDDDDVGLAKQSDETADVADKEIVKVSPSDGGHMDAVGPTNTVSKQGQQLAHSFVESVMHDVLPLDEERAFWGFARIGEDQAGLNEVLLNAWTGLLRYELLTEEVLAKALVHGRVKLFFESKCRTVMHDGFPTIEGIKFGVGNTVEDLLTACERLAFTNFQGLEWEALD